ncbi:MAG TPA: flagellar biosynthetic protein FliO [Luteimonas sp.]|mgnify:CR=1 FL=1|nr:flagellar biosynthetic protein FliO [Luteimonas sp.]HRP72277.1 flagellar biosynthetic protein FliO [Luteimonas sp.]
MMPSQRHVLSSSLLLPLPAVATATAQAPTGGSYVLELLAILLPLAFIIICLLLLLRLLRRRFGLAGPDAPLSIVQVLPVGPRERIVVVRSRAGRAFAIGVSAHSVTLVSALDSEDIGPLETPAPTQQRTDRVSLLQRFKVKQP